MNSENGNPPATRNSELGTPKELAAKCDEHLAGWKRAQADYVNLKNDTEREKAEFSKYANERLLERLLPAIDQFELALEHAPVGMTDPWMSGLKAVKNTWESAFRDIGLDHVPTDGAFDPLIHEAVGEEEAVGATPASPGQIMRVVQSGWRLNGKLLRPAKVIINSAQITKL